MTIELAFQPLIMERVMLALRQLLHVDKLTITKIGTYDDRNVVMGYRKDGEPIILYFNNEKPSIYAGELKRKWFLRSHYVISKNDHPPFDYDGLLVRYEECLPDIFELQDNMETVLGFKPNTDYKHNHRDRWHRMEISTPLLKDAVERKALKNLWSWTYEIDMNSITGTNVIYCRSKSDYQTAIANCHMYGEHDERT